MKMLKILTGLLLSAGVVLGCDKHTPGGEPDFADESVKLTVQGEPFLMLGAQLRTDYFIRLDGKSYDELEPYFSLAAKTNILVVSVPICWRDIEPSEGRYDMSLVHKFIDLCEKYKMKLELLWYGSYMCGYTVEGYVPDYVVGNPDLYPELNPSAAYQGWLGKQYYLKPNVPELVDREADAIKAMMQGIYEYDRSKGNRHTVIGIQIENEPDMLATRHNAATGYSAKQIWPDLIAMLDVLGKAVKTSPYDCYTRVNMTTTYPDFNAKAAEIAAGEGIDYVGIDPYENTLNKIELKLRWLKRIPGNFPHIAENGGEYANNDVLMLKALTMGCGYEIFEIVTTPHEFLKDWTLRGLYNPDFSEKGHTRRIAEAFGIFRGGWVDLACAEQGDIVGFNMTSDNGLYETKETQNLGKARLTWSTKGRGIAYAAKNGTHITMASTKDDSIVIEEIGIADIEMGYYDIDRNWIKEGSAVMNGQTLEMKAGTVYKIETE